ncbi:MAG TPA: hypothetical protein PK878_08590, partial [bacterium]|nr:hypothetical protein [bacterium]
MRNRRPRSWAFRPALGKAGGGAAAVRAGERPARGRWKMGLLFADLMGENMISLATVSDKNTQGNGQRQRFSRNFPCPICGGYDEAGRGSGSRCGGYLALDPNTGIPYARCTRSELAGNLERRKDGTFPHRMDGRPCRCGSVHGDPNPGRDPVPRPGHGDRSAPKRKTIAWYDYRNEEGRLLIQVCRTEPKGFYQRRPDGDGTWIRSLEAGEYYQAKNGNWYTVESATRKGWNIPSNAPRQTFPAARRVLYRLPGLLKADPSETVLIVEGEKDVHRLEEIGGVATCNPEGAGKWRYVAEPAREVLASRPVVILPDNDKPGRDHAQDVARSLYGAAASIKVVNLPGLPEKGDVSDWIEARRAEGMAAPEIKAALRDIVTRTPEWHPPADTTGTVDGEDEDHFTPALDPWPSPMAEEAYYGLAGEFVQRVNAHSESDPVADLVQFLTCFGNAIGRGPHWTVNATDHHLNLFVNLVGQTARGRKGTSLDVVLKVFGQVDENWRHDCISGGLSSGEGLKYAVRDPVLKNGEIVERGVADKRLLVLESEFANVLKVLNREGNTLSPTIRQAWDTGTIRNITKHDSIKATGAHISIIGHITKDELIQRMTETEASNGFANRFLWFAVRRSKHLPRGGNLTESELNPIVIRLHHALEHARGVGEMGMTEAAWVIWEGLYEGLTRDIPGLFGLVTARAEAQIRRLACLYALLDPSGIVDVPHLKAALAV